MVARLCFEPGHGLKKVSLSDDDLVERSNNALEKSMHVIRNMVQRVNSTMGGLTQKPSEVALRFGIKLDAEAGALIAKTGAEASIDLTLTWSNKDESKGPQPKTS